MVTWRRTIATLLLVLTPSCVLSTNERARTARTAGLVMSGIAAGGAVLGTTMPDEDDAFGLYLLMGVIGGMGLATLIAGHAQIEDAEDVPAQPPDPDAANRAWYAETRETAMRMVAAATLAASKGDCATVVKLGGLVVALGGDFYATMFAVDVTLQPCLDGAHSPSGGGPMPAPGPTPTSPNAPM